jgi:hypothetical protein
MQLFSAWLPGIAFCVVSLFCLSCSGNAGGAESSAVKGSAGNSTESRAVSALPAEDAARLPEGSSGRRMILEKGNFWVTGIPGFGENALPALSGVYGIVPLDGTASAGFSVWLCRETLYYNDWVPRAGAEDFRALEKPGRNSLLVAVPLNETWTGIFSFPDAQDLSRNDIDRIIGIYRSRALYFLALANSSSDISLPAQADF